MCSIDEISLQSLTLEEVTPKIEYKFINNGYPNFFIGDLLSAKKIENHKVPYKKEMFVVKSMLFKGVTVRGVITEMYLYNNKLRIILDDPSGSISCILEKNDKLESVREFVWTCTNIRSKECLNPNDNGPVNQVTYELLKAIKSDLDEKFSFDYNLGDSLELIGTLNEYNNRRCIFVRNARKEVSGDVANEVKYFNYVKHLHSKVYPYLFSL